MAPHYQFTVSPATSLAGHTATTLGRSNMALPQADCMVPAAKRMKFDDAIRVEVGSGVNSKIYTVHSNALTTRSEFFRKALSGAWKEAEERVVRLPDDDCDTFELYLHLVYNNELACIPDSANGKEDGKKERLSLAELYVHSEKVQDTQGKNSVIRGLVNSIYKNWVDKIWRIPEVDFVNIVYQGTVKGSPARRLILDVFACSISMASVDEQALCKYPNEFLQEPAVNAMMKRFPTELRFTARKDGGLAYLEEEEPDKKS